MFLLEKVGMREVGHRICRDDNFHEANRQLCRFAILDNVVKILMSVVLPAPLGPSKPTMVPRGISKDTPCNARTAPKDLRRSRTEIIGFVNNGAIIILKEEC